MSKAAWIEPTDITSDTGTATASSADSSWPAANVQTDYLGQPLKFTGLFRVVQGANDKIDFADPVDGTVAATISAGDYEGGAALAAQVQVNMNAAVTGTPYTVTYSTTTGKFTISRSTSTFSLLWATGTNAATNAKGLLGYTASDVPGVTTSTSVNVVVHSEDWVQFQFTVNEVLRAFFFVGHNMSSSATVRVYSHTSAMSPSATQSYEDWLIANATELREFTSDDLLTDDAKDFSGHVLLSTTPTGRDYYTVWFQDTVPRSSRTEHELGRLGLGKFTQLTRNFARRYRYDLEDLVPRSVGSTNLLLTRDRPVTRVITLDWERLQDADRLLLETLWREGRQPFPFWIDPDTGTDGEYVTCTGSGDALRIREADVNRWDVGPMVFTQIVRRTTD